MTEVRPVRHSRAASLLERPALEARLDGAFGKRLTTIIAGAGFGKTTLLTQWSRDVASAWFTVGPEDSRLGSLAAGLSRSLRPFSGGLTVGRGSRLAAPDDAMRADAVAAHLATELELQLEHDLVLVIDDVHELGGSPSARLVEGLARQAPAMLHVVLAGRTDPPFRIQRLRGQGQVLELDAHDLAFDEHETAEFLELSLGPDARSLAARIHNATGGWPAALRLAVEVLDRVDPAERETALEALQGPSGPLLGYLAEEVFEQEEQPVRDLIRAVAPFERFTPALCEALGLVDSRLAIDSLRRKGLFLAPHRANGDSLVLHSLVRDYALDRLPLSDEELRLLHRRSAEWFEANDHLEEALSSHVESADWGALSDFLARRGEELLAHGSIDPVVTTGSLLPEPRDPYVEEILGEAHSLKGEWDAALACYERAAAGAESLPPGLAWRMGRLYWDRGRLEEATAAYERGEIDGSAPTDEAFLLAWMSMPYWNLGDVPKARELAERSLEAAQASGSSRALAAAHNALGVTYVGHDHAAFERHVAASLEHAEAAGDVLQTIRATISRSGPADPLEQLQLVDDVIPLAELSGAALYLAALLNQRMGANLALGRFDAAVADAKRTLSLFEQHGSSRRSWPLMGQSAVARRRGDLAVARAGYEEAIAVSVKDAQTMIPAQSELARLLAYEQPDEARRLSDAAVDLARGLGYLLDEALLAAGWVALARGDRGQALAFAREAAPLSHRQRLMLNYAEGLELQAMASADPALEVGLLDEAAALWRASRNEVALACNRLAAARLTNDRGAAERATRSLRAAGVREQAAGAAGLLACIPPEAPEPLRIRTLGSFSVLRDGHPVPLGEWRSRKARDLLKLLIARRGRAAPREYLMEALWPGEDPRKLGNRLSVALSNLRAVLDPGKRFPAEHFVGGTKAGVALRLENLPIDVEELLADADAGFALLDEGREQEARERLLAAEEAYAGDFLEEDAYEDWAAVLREEARVAYIRVAHALAGLAVRAGELDEAARYLLRVLERDAYDEKAHFGLVHALAEAGHHGEARRCYATYAERMRDIGVEAAPYPTPRDVSAV